MATVVTGYINAAGSSSLLNYTTPQAWNNAAPADLTYTESGTCQTGSTLTYVRLAFTASSVDDFYKGRPIIIYRNPNGSQSGPCEVRYIISYTGALRAAFIASVDGARTEPLNAIPPSGSAYIIDSIVWRGVLLSSFSAASNQLNIGGSTGVNSTAYKELVAGPGLSYGETLKTSPLRANGAGVALTVTGDATQALRISERWVKVRGIQLIASLDTVGSTFTSAVSIESNNVLIDGCLLQSAGGASFPITGTGGEGVRRLVINNSVVIKNRTTLNSYSIFANTYGDFTFVNTLFAVPSDVSLTSSIAFTATGISIACNIINCVFAGVAGLPVATNINYVNTVKTSETVSSPSGKHEGIINIPYDELGFVNTLKATADFKLVATSPLRNYGYVGNVSDSAFNYGQADITGVKRVDDLTKPICLGPWEYKAAEIPKADLKFLTKKASFQGPTKLKPLILFHAEDLHPRVGAIVNPIETRLNTPFGPTAQGGRLVGMVPQNSSGITIVASFILGYENTYLEANPIAGSTDDGSGLFSWQLDIANLNGFDTHNLSLSFSYNGFTIDGFLLESFSLPPGTKAEYNICLSFVNGPQCTVIGYQNGTPSTFMSSPDVGYPLSAPSIHVNDYVDLNPYDQINIYNPSQGSSCRFMMILDGAITANEAKHYSKLGVASIANYHPQLTPARTVLPGHKLDYKVNDASLVGAYLPKYYFCRGVKQSYSYLKGTDTAIRLAGVADESSNYSPKPAAEILTNHSLFIIARVTASTTDAVAFGSLTELGTYGAAIKFNNGAFEVVSSDGTATMPYSSVAGGVTIGRASYGCVLAAGGPIMYKNGVDVIPTTTVAPTGPIIQLEDNFPVGIGGASQNGNYGIYNANRIYGEVELALHFNRFLTAQEMQELHANPYKYIDIISTPEKQNVEPIQVAHSKPLLAPAISRNRAKLAYKRPINVLGPIENCQVDWTNQLTKGLTAAQITLYDPIHGRMSFSVGGVLGTGLTPGGTGIYFDSSSNDRGSLFRINPTSPFDQEFTIITAGAPQAGSNINTLVSFLGTVGNINRSFSANMEWLGSASSGTLGVIMSDTTGSWYTSAYASGVIDGKYHVFATKKALSVLPRLYVDGVDVTTNTYVSSSPVNYINDVTHIKVGGPQYSLRFNENYTDTKGIPFSFVWNRALSDVEIRRISMNPWQLFTRWLNMFKRVD